MVHVAFLMGKARVSPLKQTTIPWQEPTAAVLAVKMPQRKLQCQLEKSVFGLTAGKYICNETRHFHTFIANTTAVIREATDFDQWRHVGS